MSIISIEHLSKTFGSGHTTVQAVKDVSLDIAPGDIILVMGPSGSGKTTLISMIGTLMQPSAGSIAIDDQDITQLNRNQLADLRLHKLGFVFQSFNLLAALTAEQNVIMPLLAAHTPKGKARGKARAMLEQLGMGHRLNHLPRDLSGGEKQRVAVARALVNDPMIILADEPTANLDSKAGKEVTTLLCNIACGEGKAVIIVSHDPRLKDVAKRVITIEDGMLTGEEKGNHDKTCPHNHSEPRRSSN
jgi:putative ABC transport system ATP-binding protein